MLVVVMVLLDLVGAISLLFELFWAEWAISSDACESLTAVHWNTIGRELKVALLDVSERERTHVLIMLE